MKIRFLLLVLLALWITYACNNPTQISEDVELYVEIDEETTENFVENEIIEEESTDVYTEEEEILKLDILYNLPYHWTMLTENDDGETIIFKPCEIQNPSISINEPNYENNRFVLYIGFGQDASIITIVDIDNTSEDTITMTSEDSTEIKFIWIDKNNGIANWEILNYFNSNFVDDNNLSEYSIVNEECDDMW